MNAYTVTWTEYHEVDVHDAVDEQDAREQAGEISAQTDTEVDCSEFSVTDLRKDGAL